MKLPLENLSISWRNLPEHLDRERCLIWSETRPLKVLGSFAKSSFMLPHYGIQLLGSSCNLARCGEFIFLSLIQSGLFSIICYRSIITEYFYTFKYLKHCMWFQFIRRDVFAWLCYELRKFPIWCLSFLLSALPYVFGLKALGTGKAKHMYIQFLSLSLRFNPCKNGELHMWT